MRDLLHLTRAAERPYGQTDQEGDRDPRDERDLDDQHDVKDRVAHVRVRHGDADGDRGDSETAVPDEGKQLSPDQRRRRGQSTAGQGEGHHHRREADGRLRPADGRLDPARTDQVLQDGRHQGHKVGRRGRDASRASEQPAGREGEQQVDQQRQRKRVQEHPDVTQDLDLVVLHTGRPQRDRRGDHQPAGRVVRPAVPGQQPGDGEGGDRDSVHDRGHARAGRRGHGELDEDQQRQEGPDSE